MRTPLNQLINNIVKVPSPATCCKLRDCRGSQVFCLKERTIDYWSNWEIVSRDGYLRQPYLLPVTLTICCCWINCYFRPEKDYIWIFLNLRYLSGLFCKLLWIFSTEKLLSLQYASCYFGERFTIATYLEFVIWSCVYV